MVLRPHVHHGACGGGHLSQPSESSDIQLLSLPLGGRPYYLDRAVQRITNRLTGRYAANR
jgi:hypothetical protein